MRIRFNVGLEPEFYDSHGYAIECLRRWQQKEKSRNDASDIVLQRRIQFHRDLYLSGLFLYELAPQLPTMLTQMLLPDSVSEQTLTNLLSSAGLALAPPAETGISEQQWSKLTDMLAEIKQTADVPATAPSDIEQSTTNLNAIELQLQQLHQLVQQGQEQLSSMQNHQSEAQTSQTDLELTAQLNQLQQGQQQLMAQITSLSNKVNQGLGHQQGNSQDTTLAPSLATQLERASRVKAKGLW